MEEKTELMKTEEEEQLDQLYYDLGKAYYEGGYEDPIPQLLPMFDAITSLKKKIEEEQALDNELHETFTDLEDLIVKSSKDDVLDELIEEPAEEKVEEALPETITCPNCGSINEAGTKFCGKCGTKLIPVPEPVVEEKKEEPVGVLDELIEEPAEEKVEEVKPETITCPNCGSVNKAGTKFCGKCGTKLIPVPEPVVEEKKEEPVGVLDELIEEPAEEKVEEALPETITCPNCGSINEAGTKFCGKCGTKLIPVPEPVVEEKKEEPVGVLDDLIEEPAEEKVEEVKPETITCPNCGSVNKAGTKFCGKCGTKLIPAPVKVEKPAPVVEEAKPETVTCPNCGSVNKAGTKFCGKCGTKLIPAPVKVEKPAPVVEEVKPETVTCPNCGSVNKAGTKFCGKCGTKLIQPVVQQSKKEGYIGTFCPACGKKITIKGNFCGTCGYDLRK